MSRASFGVCIANISWFIVVVTGLHCTAQVMNILLDRIQKYALSWPFNPLQSTWFWVMGWHLIFANANDMRLSLVWLVFEIRWLLGLCDVPPNFSHKPYCRFATMDTPSANLYDDVIEWKHFSALLAICAVNSPVPGEFPAQRPVTQSFDVLFDLRLNRRLSKQSCGWWF